MKLQTKQKMVIIPFIPVISFWVNRFTRLKGGKYEVYNETHAIRHLFYNVWYEIGDLKSYRNARYFVDTVNSL